MSFIKEMGLEFSETDFNLKSMIHFAGVPEGANDCVASFDTINKLITQRANELLSQRLKGSVKLGHRCRTMYWCGHQNGSGMWSKFSQKKYHNVSGYLVSIKEKKR